MQDIIGLFFLVSVFIFPPFGRAPLGKVGNNGVEAVIISEIGKKWKKI